MAPKIKALFDLNIILDVLQQREPFYETSAQLLAHAETGRIRGFIAPHSLTTLFYTESGHKLRFCSNGVRRTKVLPQYLKVGFNRLVAPARRRWIEPVEIASTH